MRLQSIQFEKMEGRAALRGPLKAALALGRRTAQAILAPGLAQANGLWQRRSGSIVNEH